MMKNTLYRLELVAKFALVGAVTVGTFLHFVPIAAPFDLRVIGAAVGALVSAAALFRAKRAG